MRVFAYAFSLVAAACATLVPPPQVEPAASHAQALSAYSRVLDRFVDDRGRVDFEALSHDRRDLDTYVRFIADTPLDYFAPGDERMAHLINSYNALSMYNVITSGIPETHAGWRKIVFFALRKLVIGGEPVSLYAFENDVIRKAGDPRVHFALNCSAMGCPVLPRTPFDATTLQESLDREARRFFASSEHLRVDPRARVVYVSELLRFYREDFGETDSSLIRFIDRHSSIQAPDDFTVRFIPYDWTIANRHFFRNPT